MWRAGDDLACVRAASGTSERDVCPPAVGDRAGDPGLGPVGFLTIEHTVRGEEEVRWSSGTKLTCGAFFGVTLFFQHLCPFYCLAGHRSLTERKCSRSFFHPPALLAQPSLVPMKPGHLEIPFSVTRGAGLRPDSLAQSWPLSREPTLARTVSPALPQPSQSQKAAYLLPLGCPGPRFPQSWKGRRDPPPKGVWV